MRRVIITAKAHPHLASRLEADGYRVDYMPEISYDELSDLIPDTEGLVITTRIRVDKPLLDNATHLKWIGRLGSGMEQVDTSYALEKGIRCIASPEGNRNAVAEHALGLLLSLMHKIASSREEVKKGIWKRDENRGTELTGKTVGIIGFGNTGSSFARLLQPFSLTVLAYDKYKDSFASDYVKEANLGQLCRYSDIISFHVPLTAETFYYADAGFFSSLEKKPFIINCSRGKVVNQAELLKALQKGLIKGAGLDVLENEQLGSLSAEEKLIVDGLINDPRIIITPHIAGYSEEAFYLMAEILANKILDR